MNLGLSPRHTSAHSHDLVNGGAWFRLSAFSNFLHFLEHVQIVLPPLAIEIPGDICDVEQFGSPLDFLGKIILRVS